MRTSRIEIKNYGHREYVWCYYPTNRDTYICLTDLNDYNSSDSIHYVFRQLVSMAKIRIR